MNNELYHYGVKGMKWGVRRYQNLDGSLTEADKKRQQKTIRRINTMYDRSNKWTNRKISKLDKKGKTAKANVMREMVRQNETARRRQISSVKKMNAVEFSKSKRIALKDALLGGQEFMGRNRTHMTTFLTRYNEYNRQRGMRWMSNFTANSTLARMNVSEGYEYLNRKNLANLYYNQG